MPSEGSLASPSDPSAMADSARAEGYTPALCSARAREEVFATGQARARRDALWHLGAQRPRPPPAARYSRPRRAGLGREAPLVGRCSSLPDRVSDRPNGATDPVGEITRLIGWHAVRCSLAGWPTPSHVSTKRIQGPPRRCWRPAIVRGSPIRVSCIALCASTCKAFWPKGESGARTARGIRTTSKRSYGSIWAAPTGRGASVASVVGRAVMSSSCPFRAKIVASVPRVQPAG